MSLPVYYYKSDAMNSPYISWSGCIKRRVYKVRGANSLWHMDGNEKLRPWGFYVHGCIDGFSRLMIYMYCCNNKRQATVAAAYRGAIKKYGWPSRCRGDWGKENNEVERMMIAHWGENHRAYLRGKYVFFLLIRTATSTLFFLLQINPQCSHRAELERRSKRYLGNIPPNICILGGIVFA